MNGSISKSGPSATRKERTLRQDRLLFGILLAHLPMTMFLVPMGYDTGTFALYSSALVGVFSVIAFALLRGTAAFGVVSAILLMTLSAIMIQSQLGRIEMHFHILVALAVLLIYRHWLPIVVAASLISLHHLAFTALQLNAVGFGDLPIMLFNYGCDWEITVLHLVFILVETLALVHQAIAMRRDGRLAESLFEALVAIDRNHDLTLRIPDRGEVAGITAFNGLIQKFAALTREVSKAATRIKSVSYQIDDIALSAESEISARQTRIEQAMTVITEMSQTIDRVAESTQSAATIAASTSERALDGHERFNQAVRSTAVLQKVMVEAAASMHRLKTDAVTMGSVPGTIRDLSERIDRLALEASREVERAGEPGRGFAVVAEEIGRLAERTQASSLEIQETIEKIQGNIESLLARMDDGQRRTTETSSAILQAGLALNEILESVSSISDMSAEVAQTVQTQRQVAEDIGGHINAPATHDANVIGKARANRDSAATLMSLSESLNQLVSGYRG
ncbi:methyl-accepting chemotaxis protein [Thiocystis violacea]|uniref:methyl-accepting chemotaxis protein n=1 Tax=Thiocystis violacea TaxID=13725 RepID=UPI00190365C7|nr:methyl-accepting chemotaxis protein [Thiocystis violacea]MBK1717916.1 hypothetical protein [Thiocystis violacea]